MGSSIILIFKDELLTILLFLWLQMYLTGYKNGFILWNHGIMLTRNTVIGINGIIRWKLHGVPFVEWFYSV